MNSYFSSALHERSKRLLVYISVTVGLTLPFHSCKKYEDDTELIHFSTVKQRIEGYKILTMHKKGPSNLLPYWHSRFGDFYIYLGKKCASESPGIENYCYGMAVKVYDKKTDSLICEGLWEYVSKKLIYIHFDCLQNDTTTKFPNYIHGIGGPIVKLSTNDLWFRSDESWHDSLKASVPMEIRLAKYSK